MKISELYSAVAELGFEDSLERETGFIMAVNRALLQVAAIRPQTRTLLVNHRPLPNIIRNCSFSPAVKYDELIYDAYDARAYYFECDGVGECYIEAHEGEEWEIIGIIHLSSAGEYKAYRGLIKREGEIYHGSVRLRFSGDYVYEVNNVCVYGHLRSAKEADIPAFEPFTAYDISAMASDFLSLASPPIIEYEDYKVLNQEYTVENGRILLLPYEKPGLYKVKYNHKPEALTETGEAANDEAELDLDEELCALLPCLVAAYVWADDEPEKSEYYLTLYRERASEIAARSRDFSPVKIRDAYGW